MPSAEKRAMGDAYDASKNRRMHEGGGGAREGEL